MQSDVSNIFKSSGIKNTKQRNLVYDCLKTSKQPITAEGCFMQIKSKNEKMSLSTVYRVLDALIKGGLATKTLPMDDGVAQYELIQAEHRHTITCTSCGAMVYVNGCPLVKFDRVVEKNTNYIITGHRLQMLGICPLCRNH